MRWWWERLDGITQLMSSIILPTIIIGIALVAAGPGGWLGANSILLLYAPMSLVISYVGIRTLIETARRQYSIYREENPTEAEIIILKLKGKL
jgi:hypothetical protein